MEVWYMVQHRKIESNFFMFYVDDNGDVIDSDGFVFCSYANINNMIKKEFYEITYLDTINDEEEHEEVQVTEFFGGYDHIIIFVAIALFIYISIELYI